MKTIVLIPAYNEAEHIGEIVSRLKKSGYISLVVDDASSDDTYSIAKAAGAVVVRHKSNRGKGEGIKTGLSYIDRLKPKYIVVMDADLQYAPEDVPKMERALDKGADFIMGCRDWSKVPFRHKFGNIVWRLFFNTLFGTRMSDTNCGFMAMRASAAKKIKDIHGGYIIENYILSQLVRGGVRISQVPVTIHYRHMSGIMRGLKMVLGVLFFIIVEGIKYRLGRE